MKFAELNIIEPIMNELQENDDKPTKRLPFSQRMKLLRKVSKSNDGGYQTF